MTFQGMIGRTTHADALHQQGAFDEARALFEKAEPMQKERQPEYPLLYSLRGFRYCDFLLGPAERAAWRLLLPPSIGEQRSAPGGARSSDADMDRAPPGAQNAGEAIQSKAGSGLLRYARNEDAVALAPLLDACADVVKRAEQTLGWLEGRLGRLSVALDHLTLARAALYATILRGAAPDGAHVDTAANGLRDAGTKDYLPRGLLTRALYRAVAGDFTGAQDDLDEAYDIAERGPMKLHLADIHLHRARLFGLYAKRPQNYPWDSPGAISPRRGGSSKNAAIGGARKNWRTPRRRCGG